MRNVVQLPALKAAARTVARDAGYPLELQVVQYKTYGAPEMIPAGMGYAIGVSQDTTVNDIFNLEPVIERLGNQVFEYMNS